MTDPRFSALPIPVWRFLGLAAVALFYAAVSLLFLCVQHRRKGLLALSLSLLPLTFVLMEAFFGLFPDPAQRGAVHRAVQNVLLSLPPWTLMTLILALAGLLLVLWLRLLRFRRTHITPTSVREALDSLPMGVCCYLPGGQLVLSNAMMEAVCAAATGRPLISGTRFYRDVEDGRLAPDCRCVDTGEGRVLLLPDGSARLLTVRSCSWDRRELTVLLAANVTEIYHKTLALEDKRKALYALNRRLAAYNREIVDLTIESEILTARVRLHDAMGEDLLTMKRAWLQPVDEASLAALRERLRRNVSFLREDPVEPSFDEYAVLLRTAERLGVRTEILGELSRTESARRVVTTGLHECLTNLLRHAHGDLLRLELQKEEGRIVALFSGNGDPPSEPVRETGGLHTLRRLTESLGGTMTVYADPTLRVRLSLPCSEDGYSAHSAIPTASDPGKA